MPPYSEWTFQKIFDSRPQVRRMFSTGAKNEKNVLWSSSTVKKKINSQQISGRNTQGNQSTGSKELSTVTEDLLDERLWKCALTQG